MVAVLPGYACCSRPTGSSALQLVIVAPVLEELLFRGVLQGRLLETTWGRDGRFFTRANLATSACFAVFHLVSHAWAWSLAAFVPSLVFGHFRDRYRSLMWPIVVHAFYNAGYLTISS